MSDAAALKTLVAEMAKIYHSNSPDFAGGYEEQARSPEFLRMLSFNCLVMDAVHGCGANGCAGCLADRLYREQAATMDERTRELIDEARRIVANRHGIAPRVVGRGVDYIVEGEP